MEVKAPYKQTAVGLIPDEWDVQPLLTMVRIANGQVDPRIEPYKSMVLVAPDHIESRTGRLLEKRTATEQQAISGKYLFAAGDIVYSKIRPYLQKAILADFDGLCSADMYPLRPAGGTSAGFVLAVLLGSRFTKYAESVSVRSGMPKINRAELAEYSIAAPPPLEQRAIARVLKDVDALLNASDTLIAKKRDFKQAAMQQLLTGKTRLPSYGGEWEMATLGEVASVSKGTQLHSSEAGLSGTFAHLNGGMAPSGYTHKANTAGNTIAISEGGNSCGYVQFMPEPYWSGGHCYSVIQNNIDNGFLYHALKGRQSAIMGLRVGSGLPNVQKTALLGLEIRYPPTASEQSAIAELLSDMDAEISALEARRDKTRLLKQGMLQELLSGSTRLL